MDHEPVLSFPSSSTDTICLTTDGDSTIVDAAFPMMRAPPTMTGEDEDGVELIVANVSPISDPLTLEEDVSMDSDPAPDVLKWLFKRETPNSKEEDSLIWLAKKLGL